MSYSELGRRSDYDYLSMTRLERIIVIIKQTNNIYQFYEFSLYVLKLISILSIYYMDKKIKKKW